MRGRVAPKDLRPGRFQRIRLVKIALEPNDDLANSVELPFETSHLGFRIGNKFSGLYDIVHRVPLPPASRHIVRKIQRQIFEMRSVRSHDFILAYESRFSLHLVKI